MTNPYLAATNFSSCQATLKRLDRAFQAFFQQLKVGETPGSPRFKGHHRFDTVEFKAYGDGCKLDGHRVYFQHVGRVRVKLHRPIESIIKTVSFTRQADRDLNAALNIKRPGLSCQALTSSLDEVV